MSSEERCPHCGSEEYYGEECYDCQFLKCPLCGEVVNDFGEIGEFNPCEHVVAWGIIGEYDIYWRIDEWETKFRNYFDEKVNNAEEDSERLDEGDYIEEFANENRLEFIIHSDEAGHGGSRAVFIVFLTS